MPQKIKNLISVILLAVPSLLLTMSSVMKLTGAKQVVEDLSKKGLGNYSFGLGCVELLSVILLWLPKTRNLGFFLLCAYLGGAAAIELANGQPPSAIIFLTLIWISVFLKDKTLFLKPAVDKKS